MILKIFKEIKMKTLKSLLALFLTLTVVILPTACSSGKGGSNNKPTSSLSSVEDSSSSSQEVTPPEISSSQEISSSAENSVVSTPIQSVAPQSSVSIQPACAHTLTQTKTVEPTTTTDGRREFSCTKCQETFTTPIPKLNGTNYKVVETDATCAREGIITYISDAYGSYSVKGGNKLNHSAYKGACIKCGQTLYDNLDFDQNNMINVSNTGAGPRMIILKNGDFLVSFDDGANSVKVVRSKDKGKTWVEETTVITVAQGNLAANTSLYQFENGDILCAYRIHGTTGLTGASEEKYIRKIQCSISSDNGKTWSYHSTIVDVYKIDFPTIFKVTQPSTSKVNSTIESLSSKWVGVYEPCFGEIDGKLTVMYADDFSSKIKQGNNSHASQLIMSATWDSAQNKWIDTHICLDGTINKSVAGFNRVSRDGMPVFAQLNDAKGTVVLVTEGTYMDGADSPNRHPFVICLSYSTDKGKTFTTPKVIFIPRQDKAKGAAPYVCVTEDNRLVVSYQTDEDLPSPGYDDPSTPNLNEADAYSVMKVMISDGTPVEKITGPENFLDAINVFGTPKNYGSSWNGMYLSGDTIYCVTGTDWNMNGGYGIKMQSSKIPTYPEWLHYNSCESNLFVRNGGMSVSGNKITTTQANTLVTHTTTLYNGTISVDVVPSVAQDVALIFRASPTSTTQKFWEDVNYYVFMLNFSGEVFISKIAPTWEVVLASQRPTSTYDPTKGYSLKVEINNDVITCYLNDAMILSFKDESLLTGTTVGIRAAKAGAMFWNFTAEPKTN